MKNISEIYYNISYGIRIELSSIDSHEFKLINSLLTLF
jgi:hypothetical protein